MSKSPDRETFKFSIEKQSFIERKKYLKDRIEYE